MMVKTETKDLLVMEHVPWAARFFTFLFTLICIGVAYRHHFVLGNTGWAVVFIAGAAVLAFGFLNTLQRIRLTMDRSAGTVVVLVKTLFGRSEARLLLQDVRRARVERKRTIDSHSSRGHHVAKRAVLDVRGREEPVALAMSYQTGIHATVTSRIINDWLKGEPAN